MKFTLKQFVNKRGFFLKTLCIYSSKCQVGLPNVKKKKSYPFILSAIIFLYVQALNALTFQQ